MIYGGNCFLTFNMYTGPVRGKYWKYTEEIRRSYWEKLKFGSYGFRQICGFIFTFDKLENMLSATK